MLREIYFRDITDLKFSPDYMEISDKIEALLSKIRMLLYTNRGEVLGEPDLGMDLESYLFEPGLNESVLRDRFYAQLAKYVPEHVDYSIDCSFDTQSDGFSNTAFMYILINNEKVLGIQV